MTTPEARADRRHTKLVARVAVAVSIVAIGCATGIGISTHAANKNANNNTCAIQSFLEQSKTRTVDLKLPGYKEAQVTLQHIQDQLHPHLSSCDGKYKVVLHK